MIMDFPCIILKHVLLGAHLGMLPEIRACCSACINVVKYLGHVCGKKLVSMTLWYPYHTVCCFKNSVVSLCMYIELNVTDGCMYVDGRAGTEHDRCISQDGQTALHLAANHGHLEVVKHLCDVGCKELMMMQAKVCLYAVEWVVGYT
jgi:hypothetical protein